VLVAAEREDALLGAALFLVTPGAAEGRVEAELVERLLERLGLHDVGVHGGAVGEGVDALRDAVRVGVHDQVEAELLRDAVAQLVHRPELPAGVDVQQRKWGQSRVESLQRDVQHRRAVLADRVEHDRVVALGNDLAHDLDAFGFQTLQVREPRRRHEARVGDRRRCGSSAHEIFTTVRPVTRPWM
jgi:hypothetical protein